MWFDGERQPNTIYVANVSRGKDSTAMLRAIRLMGWPLDAIVSVDIWATQDIPAELPPMVEFKEEWDRKCLENFGIPVTRLCATKRERETVGLTMESVTHEKTLTKNTSTEKEKLENSPDQLSDFQCNKTDGVNNSSTTKLTYEDIFYRKVSPQRERERENGGADGTRTQVYRRSDSRCNGVHGATPTSKGQHFGIYGFPGMSSIGRAQWCTGELKTKANNVRIPYANSTVVSVKAQRLKARQPFSDQRPDKAQKINIVHYIGIAVDEPERIKRHMPKKDKVLPLVQIGWDEALCGLEATYLDMLSPTYTTSMRDGCWFCHNQGVDQLRNLRHNYPDLWALLLKWDKDSPATFHADGHTVHDFDKRFALEDEGLIDPNEKFRWSMLENQQMRLF